MPLIVRIAAIHDKALLSAVRSAIFNTLLEAGCAHTSSYAYSGTEDPANATEG